LDGTLTFVNLRSRDRITKTIKGHVLKIELMEFGAADDIDDEDPDSGATTTHADDDDHDDDDDEDDPFALPSRASGPRSSSFTRGGTAARRTMSSGSNSSGDHIIGPLTPLSAAAALRGSHTTSGASPPGSVRGSPSSTPLASGSSVTPRGGSSTANLRPFQQQPDPRRSPERNSGSGSSLTAAERERMIDDERNRDDTEEGRPQWRRLLIHTNDGGAFIMLLEQRVYYKKQKLPMANKLWAHTRMVGNKFYQCFLDAPDATRFRPLPITRFARGCRLSVQYQQRV
jgi:hypothetical protein